MAKPSRCKSLIAIALLVFVALIAWAAPAYAITVANQTVCTIDIVDVYNNVLTNGDWAVFVNWTVKYSSLPTEQINETYLVTLTDSSDVTTYATATPQPLFHQGYDKGLVAFYINAADVTTASLVWGGGTVYHIHLMGNPSATWVGTPPDVSHTIVAGEYHNQANVASSRAVVTSKLLYWAQYIETGWGDLTNYKLVQPSPLGGFQLTPNGHSYFGAVVPYLSTIAPNILSANAEQPELVRHPPKTNTGWQGTIDAMIDGTILDMQPLADLLGMSDHKRVVTTILWLALTVAVVVGMTRKVKSYKPAVLLSIPLLLCGGLIGWISIYLDLGFAFFMCVATWYVFTYEKSST